MSQAALIGRKLRKKFIIPHDPVTTVRGAFIQRFRKKTFEEFLALDDVSFEIQAGEFFGIIGRNGSGKSTLLKILAGIYEPDGGNVTINGRISPFLELGIGFNPELSGRDNVYLNATVLGLAKQQVDEKFHSIVAFSELERFIDQKLKNYSSGMQARLAFSVAIHANREILLMDEVLAVGDLNFQQKCLDEFLRYRDRGRTVVLVSHDIETIRRYCDRALLLRNGKIQRIGNAEEVCNQYVYQNMSDEELRLFEEQSKKSDVSEKPDSKPKKVARIEHVELFRDGKRSGTFQAGTTIEIVVTYEIFQTVQDPIFGLIIHDERKVPIFVSNTKYLRIKTGTVKPGMVKVRFIVQQSLANARFYISPAIADATAKIFYDWQDNLTSFLVMNPCHTGGVVDFPHTIQIES